MLAAPLRLMLSYRLPHPNRCVQAGLMTAAH